MTYGDTWNSTQRRVNAPIMARIRAVSDERSRLNVLAVRGTQYRTWRDRQAYTYDLNGVRVERKRITTTIMGKDAFGHPAEKRVTLFVPVSPPPPYRYWRYTAPDTGRMEPYVRGDSAENAASLMASYRRGYTQFVLRFLDVEYVPDAITEHDARMRDAFQKAASTHEHADAFCAWAGDVPDGADEVDYGVALFFDRPQG